MAPKKVGNTDMTLMEVKPPCHGHLGPGNFSISQEAGLIKPSMCSVFQKHYTPYEASSRHPPAEPPALGQVMHKDRKFFNEMTSETSKSFEYRPTDKPVLENAQEKLSTTNFKMDRDMSKFNSFTTTSEYYFPPKVNSDYRRPRAIIDHVSHIPNGDPGKAPAPISDYRDKFLGHDTSVVKVVKAKSMHEEGPSTLPGDSKCLNFSTSHGDHFPYKWQHRLPSFYPATGTSVPKGDTEKIVLRDTTMRTSFPPIHGASQPRSKHDIEAISHALRKTNFKQDDGHNSWSDYVSTANTSFQFFPSNYKKAQPLQYRNHSDFPQGDRKNDHERVTMTTNKYYHGNPALGLHNTIVHGADRLTKSNVLFGEPEVKQPSVYFSTTTSDIFTPKSAPYTYHKNKYSTTASCVPIKYYKNETANTTAQLDFTKPQQTRQIYTQEDLDKLAMTNFVEPWRNERTFDTTHQTMYTTKPMEKFTIDSGKMQRSSVPLGSQALLSAQF